MYAREKKDLARSLHIRKRDIKLRYNGTTLFRHYEQNN